MIPDGSYTAVVDRFEDELAVLEVTGDDERYEHVLKRTEIPEDARQADAVLVIEFEDGHAATIDHEPEETTTRKEDAQSRFDRLSKRPPRDDNE